MLKRYDITFEVEGFIEMEDDVEDKVEDILDQHLNISLDEEFSELNHNFWITAKDISEE